MDVLSKAGASQMHPHLHIIMAPSRYYGIMEELHSASIQYLKRTERSYFTDLVSLYFALDLGVKFRSAYALAMMVSSTYSTLV